MENQETSLRDYYYHLSSMLWDKRVKTVHVLGVLTRVKFGSTWWFDCVIADNKPYQNQWISATCLWSCENVAPCKRRDSIRWYSLKLASTNRIKGSLMYFHFCHEGLSRGTCLWTFGASFLDRLLNHKPNHRAFQINRWLGLTWLRPRSLLFIFHTHS